jgi:hypothetical protein
VIGKAFLRRQARHADVNARLLGITLRIFRTHFSDFSHGGVEQHDVDIVVLFWVPFGAKLSERAALHSKRFSGGGSVSNAWVEHNCHGKLQAFVT